MLVARRTFLRGIAAVIGASTISGCGDDSEKGPIGDAIPSARRKGTVPSAAGGWRMPAEEEVHDRTWMCWPSSSEVWGSDLAGVQDTIVEITLAIARFEPVAMLARGGEIEVLGAIFGDQVELMAGPVDDLWARDTLPNFVVRTSPDGSPELAAAHATFNGWGRKQIHDGDARLAGLLAQQLGIELFDSGLVGEGGAIEIDGTGTVMAAESCWVNDNRNPGKSREEIETALLEMLAAERMIWVDGLVGYDITDGHIDALARFASASTIFVDVSTSEDPDDPWAAVATTTRELVSKARTSGGESYEIVEIVQPVDIRGRGRDFLATYMNYYVCNGAVIAPEFGDAIADAAARELLSELLPDREIVMLNIDALAAGGGGIHCATQQQPELM